MSQYPCYSVECPHVFLPSTKRYRDLPRPNAVAQARQTAGATQERTLFAVACSRLLCLSTTYMHLLI